MRKIDGYSLWIGTARDARDVRALSSGEIAAVVDLAQGEPVASPPRELVYLRFPLVDGAGNPAWLVRAAISAVRELVSAGVPTLVSCGAGMSRAPCVAAAALAEIDRQPAEDMLRWICTNGQADVSPAFWSAIIAALAK